MNTGSFFFYLPLHTFYDFTDDNLAIKLRILLDNQKVMQVIRKKAAFKVCHLIRYFFSFFFNYLLASCHVVVCNFLTKVAASGVNYNIEILIFILIDFNKVVAGSQASKRFPCLIVSYMAAAAQTAEIKLLRQMMYLISHFKTRRHTLPNHLIQLLTFELLSFHLRHAHAAANINAYEARQNTRPNRHSKAHRTDFAGVYVRHQADFASFTCPVITNHLNLSQGVFIDCSILVSHSVDICRRIFSFHSVHIFYLSKFMFRAFRLYKGMKKSTSNTEVPWLSGFRYSYPLIIQRPVITLLLILNSLLLVTYVMIGLLSLNGEIVSNM